MRLKEIRTGKGLSVPQLVELSGVPRRTIQDLESRGDGRISTAIKLADALGVTLDELCRDEKPSQACGGFQQTRVWQFFYPFPCYHNITDVPPSGAHFFIFLGKANKKSIF